MNNWINFPLVGCFIIGMWSCAAILLLLANDKRKLIKGTAYLCTFVGSATLLYFIADLWYKLERPPLRTLGETRLWYSFFLSAIGAVSFWRWRMRWLLSYSLAMGALFLFINLLNPQTYNRALMPALRSPWFIPHVIVYLFSYAVLAASCLVAFRALWQIRQGKGDDSNASLKAVLKSLKMADQLVMIGFAFLSLGLLFGALWAKEAWGHYWNWDPKETWAFLTWVSYLIYIHYRHWHRRQIKMALWTLSLSFCVLLLSWFGIHYLPAAKTSVHTYSQEK